MRSMLHTGASILLKVSYEDGAEKTIGFARNFSYAVVQGQKLTYTVDSVIAAEIAQGASPSFVKGSLTVYLPKGTTPESIGLVPYRTDETGNNIAATSKFIHFHLYDRATLNKIFSCEYCKVGSYTVAVSARGVAEVSLQFDGLLGTPGVTI